MKHLLLTLAFLTSLNVFSQNFEYKGTGNLTDLSSWQNVDAPHAAPTSFTANANIFYIDNVTGDLTLDASWTLGYPIEVLSSVNLIVDGAKTINGIGCQVNIISNGTITITSSANSAVPLFGTQTSGVVIYNTAARVYSTTYNNLIIATTTTLTSSAIVKGELTINSGIELDLNNSTITIEGSINCLGTLKGIASPTLTSSTAPVLILRGTGPSTVAFTPGFETVKTFSVTNSPASLITLNSNLGISNNGSSIFAVHNGTLDISGRQVITNSNSKTDIGSAILKTTNTSSLQIGGSGAITGGIVFDQSNANLSEFVLARASQTLSLSSNLTVANTTSLTAGTLALNGKILTLNGAITVGSGSISSTTTSTLNVGGSGTITGSLPIGPSIYDLTLNRSGETLTLAQPLNVFNSVNPTAGTIASNGNLTFKNSSGQKSQLGVVGGAVTGNINVESYIPGTIAAWNSLGAPGVSGLTVANWDGGSGSATKFAMTCSGCTYDSTAVSPPFNSVRRQTNGTGTYLRMTSASSIDPGDGLFIFIGDSRTTAIDISLTSTGPAVTGNVVANNVFISNPYASPISVDALIARYPSITALSVYNSQSKSYSPVVSGSIPVGQGFYVQPAMNITFQETDKIASNSSLLRTSSKNSTSKFFQLKLTGTRVGEYDNALIRFSSNATNTFDASLDVYKQYMKLANMRPSVKLEPTSISTMADGKELAVNSLPLSSSTETLVLPISLKGAAARQYTISAVDVQNLPSNSCVNLNDKLLNTSHNLSASDYVFTTTDSITTANRFELVLCSESIITTNLKNAEVTSNSVLISQDGSNGVFIKTAFEKSIKSVISVYNIVGQKIGTDKEIEGSNNTLRLDFANMNTQILIIKVSNENGHTIKKVFVN